MDIQYGMMNDLVKGTLYDTLFILKSIGFLSQKEHDDLIMIIHASKYEKALSFLSDKNDADRRKENPVLNTLVRIDKFNNLYHFLNTIVTVNHTLNLYYRICKQDADQFRNEEWK